MTTSRPVALVTGASAGIGRATATRLAEAGFEVVGTSRNASRVIHLDGVAFLDLDVASEESVTAAVEEVVERFGRLDVLVNNAGVGAIGAAEERSLAQDQQVIDINLIGVLRMTKAVLPHMRAQGNGRIINISSVLGLVPAPYAAIYSASKHALEGYSESLDHEVREHGIRVLLVEPGYTKTDFDGSLGEPEQPLEAYTAQRQRARHVLVSGMKNGDDPGVVATTIVTSILNKSPRIRRPAGRTAAVVSILRRFAPARLFDNLIRKINRIP